MEATRFPCILGVRTASGQDGVKTHWSIPENLNWRWACLLSMGLRQSLHLSEPSLPGGGEGGDEVAQSCPTLCDPVGCSLPGSSVCGILQAKVLSGLPFPSPGDLPNPGIEPRSPTLQADALPSEPPRKPVKLSTIF